MTETISEEKKPPNRRDLTSGSVPRHLWRMTWPMGWGIAAILSFHLIDAWFIALLGTQELAALGFTLPVTMALFSLVMGMTIGMASVAARLIGRGQMGDVRRVVTHGLLIAFGIGLVLAVIGILTMNPLFAILGAGADMKTYISDYMVIWYWGLAFLAVPMVGNAAMRAAGDTLIPGFIMTIVAVVNIILDPILIFGLFGFPRMEMQGAALATVIANASAMCALLVVMHKRDHLLITSWAKLHLNLLGDSFKRLMHIALPVGMMGLITPLATGILVALLAPYGSTAVAAFGVVMRIEAFVLVPVMAVAAAMSPIMGQNFGAKRYGRTRETMRVAVIFSTIWCVFAAVILTVFAYPVSALFSDNTRVIEAAALYLQIVPWSFAFGALINLWSSAFNALGVPSKAVMLIVTRMILVQIPLAILGGFIFGVVGIFASVAAANLLAGLTFHIWNRAMFLYRIEELEHPHIRKSPFSSNFKRRPKI